MPAPLPIKVCPFCLVDARTDDAQCGYCGSSYERAVVPNLMPVADMHPRIRTYDGILSDAHDPWALSVPLALP